MSNFISKCRAFANFNDYVEEKGISHNLKNNLLFFLCVKKALSIFRLSCTFHRIIK